MNWEAIGAVGELLGALAVVVTLAYLVVQLKQNAIVMKAQTRSAITDQILRINDSVVGNPALLQARSKANANLALSDDEQNLLAYHMTNWLRHWENVHFQYRHGTYDESEYFAQRTAWLYQLTVSSYWRDRWKTMSVVFSPEFVIEINRLIDEARKDDVSGDA